MPRLFPFSEYWWFYAAFAGLIGILLALDLAAHRKTRPLSMRTATLWTAFWVFIGLGFSVVVYLLAASQHGAAVATRTAFEYLTGYLVEESLSVDNMFVFAVLFRYFALSGSQQHRVLLYGIVGAMVFRGIFVVAGSALIQFHWVVIAFGLFLVLSGLRMAFGSGETIKPERNLAIRFIRRFVPVTAEPHGNQLIVRDAGGIRITALLVALLVVESTDIMFAMDSVPAVFAVTREPLIVYTSNIFAILGLRAIYLVVSGAFDRFAFLKYGVSIVLVFVGLKMAVLDDLAGGRFPIAISLAVIASVVTGSIGLSVIFRAPGTPRNRLTGAAARKLIGSLFAALCCASLALAVGVRPPFLDVTWLEAIKPEWLYVSGLCHGVVGWVLLRARGHGVDDGQIQGSLRRNKNWPASCL
jgi:tellurite resistance protein TerC